MRCMDRNKQSFYYALYQGKAKTLDADGNKTGESALSYGTPIQAWGRIGPARGTASVTGHGIEIDYDNTLTVEDPDFPVKEDSILWIGADPEKAHNYTVRRVSRAFDHATYQLKRVTVT